MVAAWDVFISYSSKDRTVVQPLAERLRADGLRVWFDQWEVPPGAFIPEKIEAGLERSRVLVVCLSGNGYGSDWTRLESWTFRFRDPTNEDGRFIPLRLDDSPIPGSLINFRYIDWREGKRLDEYPRLLAACQAVPSRPDQLSEENPASVRTSATCVASVRSVALNADGTHAILGGDDDVVRLWDLKANRCLNVLEGHGDRTFAVALTTSGKQVLVGGYDKTVRLWDLESNRCLKVLEGHTDWVCSVAISVDGGSALSGSRDGTVRLWGVENGDCVKVLEGHTAGVNSVVLSANGKCAVSGADDETIRLWDLKAGRCRKVFKGHTAGVKSIALSADDRLALSASEDSAIRLWDLENGYCLKVLLGHTAGVNSVALSADGKRALSGADDKTIRFWDLESGRCLKVLEGHTDWVLSVALSADGERAVSGSDDKTCRSWEMKTGRCLGILAGHIAGSSWLALSADGRCALSGSDDKALRLWDLEKGRCLKILDGHDAGIGSVALSADVKRGLSGSHDGRVKAWNIETGQCFRLMKGHTAGVGAIQMSVDGRRALSGSEDSTLRLWDIETGHCLKVMEGHSRSVQSVAISTDAKRAVSGSDDMTLRLWDVETGNCLNVLTGHTAGVRCVTMSADSRRALSGGDDSTLRLWDIESGRCLKVLEGHSDSVLSVAISTDGKQALSGGADKMLRLWDLRSGRCLNVLKGHAAAVRLAVLGVDGEKAFSAGLNGVVRAWQLSASSAIALVSPVTDQEPSYTNAKVLLVGDSGAGKTGLARCLAQGIRDKGDNTSTDGAWATQLRLPQKTGDAVEREIWLWDFAGQVDYRLVHQLYMDDTAAAVLVFNPQNENLFEGLGQWDRDLDKATRGNFAKLLVAGRVDRGGLVVSMDSVRRFMAERSFYGDLHLTSALTGQGCDELRQAITTAIDWQSIPETASPALYRRMKEEILHLRDSGLVLLRLAELKQRMELTLRDQHFDLAQLETVVGLLAGPGIIGWVRFGGFVLLRPEVLSRYAAALVRKVRSHPDELGCISENELLSGDLDYQDFQRLPKDDEAVILRHLHETLVSRAWCLRQPSDHASSTAVLTFPSYFRRQRPEMASHPNIIVTYRFAGPADEIYATLVVRLHHTAAFTTDQLWRSAADFRTQTGKRLGVLLTRESEGHCRLDAYFAPDVDENSRLLFLRYIHDHLTTHAEGVARLRHYVCPSRGCGRPFRDRELIEEALRVDGSGSVFCPRCQTAIQLVDPVEEGFTSVDVKQQARRLEVESRFRIDNESRELILIAHAHAVAGEAGQEYRSYVDNDHGIDGEIGFKDDNGGSSGQRLYLQLTLGASYERSGDRADIFQIRNPSWASNWKQRPYPVMLVIFASDGAMRWMNVRNYLQRESRGDDLPTRIVFEGERFDAMAVRRYRDRAVNIDRVLSRK